MSRQSKRGITAVEPPIQVGDYTLDKVLGQGTYGKVRLGIHATTGEQVAIKVIEKSQIKSPKQVARLQREIRFLKLLNHPHIVKVVDVIETLEFIYIVMEYAVGGELFDYIVANKRVQETEARHFFRMVLSAVEYCHQNAIIHRDLKPENLLLDDKKNIKIIDFGFGNNFSSTGLLDTFCGSPFYAAPEMILGKKYEGPEVDMWSLGVILFALLCGHLPFDDDNMKELYKKIANGTYKTPDHVPTNARHLINRLITVDPKKRATLKEVLQHPWVNEGHDTIPQSYIPKRLYINDPSTLSKDITNRLEIFGYSKHDIMEAFSPNQDHSKPSAIRSTYHLLSEMVLREQHRLRTHRKQQQKLAESRSTFTSANTLHEACQSQCSITEEGEESRRVGMRTVSHYQGPSGVRERSAVRRQSLPLMIPNAKPHSTADKLREEFRVVSGWFLNYSTTSTKSQSDILGQLFGVLGSHMVRYEADRCSFQCEIDYNHVLFERTSGIPVKPQLVEILVEISKVPKMELNAIHFKRLTGGVWNYKKVANKILSKLVL